MNTFFNLLELAKQAAALDLQKSAVVAAGGGAPPAGAAPPMDPAMMGGMPGGAPPTDPAMMGGMPPMDPAMMGGMPPEAGMPAPPPPATEPPPEPAPTESSKKVKIDEWMVKHDQRLYAMQQQLNAIMNALGAQVSNDAMVLPPGPELPVPDDEVPTDVPAVAEDPGMDAATPAGGGEVKTASSLFGDRLTIDSWFAKHTDNPQDVAAMTRILLGSYEQNAD